MLLFKYLKYFLPQALFIFCRYWTLYLHYLEFQLTFRIWKEDFESILGKGENAGNQHFLVFPKIFPVLKKKEKTIFDFSLSEMLSIRTSLKFCRMGRS